MLLVEWCLLSVRTFEESMGGLDGCGGQKTEGLACGLKLRGNVFGGDICHNFGDVIYKVFHVLNKRQFGVYRTKYRN